MTRFVQEVVKERDRQELSLGDTLDVKTGILFAAITVLGALTAALLGTSGLGRPFQTAQVISLGLLAAGALFAVSAIWPRDYLLPDFPEAYLAWLHQLEDFYQGDPERAESEFEVGMTNKANERIHRNYKINSEKSRWLIRAFWPTFLALLIDIGTLASLGAVKLLS